MTDLGDPKDVSRRTKDTLRARKERHEMLRAIMGLKQGRAWLFEILEWTHVNASSVGENPYTVYFLEGERNVGLRIQADVTTACPEEYILMLREHGEKDDQDALVDANDGSGDGGDSSPGTDSSPGSAIIG